jgi:hypothetical protein
VKRKRHQRRIPAGEMAVSNNGGVASNKYQHQCQCYEATGENILAASMKSYGEISGWRNINGG